MKLTTRYLWPSFFSNDDVAELEPLERIFFQGLWCAADRDGRMMDSPKRLKVLILPYDSKFDPEKALARLSEKGLIHRYIDPKDHFPVIQVAGWEKNGKPFRHEKSLNISPFFPSLMQASGKLDPSYSSGSCSSSSSEKEKGGTGEKEKTYPQDEDVREVFLAYCKSWGKDPNRYELTPKRAEWIREAIRLHEKAGALLGVVNFRNDDFEDRARFNDLEYLFGGTKEKQRKRIDKFCSVALNPATEAARREHKEESDTLESALEMVEFMGNGDDGTT